MKKKLTRKQLENWKLTLKARNPGRNARFDFDKVKDPKLRRDIKELVKARLRRLPDGIRISIG